MSKTRTDAIISRKKIEKKSPDNRFAVSLTFGDCAENHAGMQKIGKEVKSGFSVKMLESFRDELKDRFICEMVYLNEYLPDDIEEKVESAAVLIVRNYIKDPDTLFKEQLDLKVDTKAKMRGKVVNKHARHNLCYADFEQQPDYENGKGTVVKFDNVPNLSRLRRRLQRRCEIDTLLCELNLYFDKKKCGIGFHGDSERKIVICARLGYEHPLHYQWFKDSKSIGKRCELELRHGDLYIMSEKATGYD